MADLGQAKDGRVIAIDVDGVLTDGSLTIDHLGQKLFKRFHTRDVRAIRELVYRGWYVVLVTADDWEGIHEFAKKVGAEVIITRDKSSLPFSDYVAVGDDAWDIGMLKKARTAFAPSDAVFEVLEAVPTVRLLPVLGGQGVVAAMLPILIKECEKEV